MGCSAGASHTSPPVPPAAPPSSCDPIILLPDETVSAPVLPSLVRCCEGAASRIPGAGPCDPLPRAADPRLKISAMDPGTEFRRAV